MAEIMLVLLVIGILAGITIVSYGSWRKNIAVSQVRSELNGVAGAMESARNFASTYPITIPTTFKSSSNVTLTYIVGNTKTYCIEATTTQDPSIKYRYDTSEKADPQNGPCVSAVTNLAHNPNPTSSSYWKSSATGNMTVSFVSSGGYSAVRSTRATTSLASLYGERNGTGMTTATTGVTHTILFTIVSNVTTSLDFNVGYGNSSSTTVLGGTSSQTISLVANVPQTIRKTFTVASGFDGQPLFFKLDWNSGVGAIGNYFDVYRVMWAARSYTGAYADGYNTSDGWSWSGSTNLSTSSGPAL